MQASGGFQPIGGSLNIFINENIYSVTALLNVFQLGTVNTDFLTQTWLITYEKSRTLVEGLNIKHQIFGNVINMLQFVLNIVLERNKIGFLKAETLFTLTCSLLNYTFKIVHIINRDHIRFIFAFTTTFVVATLARRCKFKFFLRIVCLIRCKGAISRTLIPPRLAVKRGTF